MLHTGAAERVIDGAHNRRPTTHEVFAIGRRVVDSYVSTSILTFHCTASADYAELPDEFDFFGGWPGGAGWWWMVGIISDRETTRAIYSNGLGPCL